MTAAIRSATGEKVSGQHAATQNAAGQHLSGQSVSVGGTLWLTGLSGAGKTTLASALAERVRAADPARPVEILDGDELREHLSPGLGFSKEDRDAHVTRVGYLARLLARNGVFVIVPVIAPYADARERVRTEHEADGARYVQVYLSTSVDTCARRDVKGLYAGHAAGRVTHLTGVDDPYEIPTSADLALDTTDVPVAESLAAIEDLLTERGLL